jgi:hypothetical protein
MNLMRLDWTKSWWLGFSVPDAASAVATGVLTSVICALLRLKDVASALYFAPLLFPSIILAIFFSVVWIPICVGSCLAVPTRAIFAYIAAAIFVKLPINLIAGLAAGSLVKSPPYHTLRTIHCRRLVSSRRLFLTLASALLFFIVWPIAEYLSASYGIGVGFEEWLLFLPSIPLWFLASACIGIASLGLAEAVDWGIFAFVSAAGAGLVLWVVLLLNALVVEQTHGMMQLSVHVAVTGIVCLGLSFSAGSVSAVAAVLWVVLRGVPAKIV